MKRKSLIIGLVIGVMMGGAAFAGTAKVFIYNSYLTNANLSDPAVQVFSTATDQAGAGTALTLDTNYTVDTSAMYNGVTPSLLVDVNNCPTNTVYILLKTAQRYAIVSASAPDIPGPDQTPAVKSYKLGKPAAPIVADTGIKSGFETAQVAWTLDPDYDYNKIYFKLSKNSDLTAQINDSKASPETNVKGLSPYAFGEYVDGRTLESGAAYYIGLWGTVAGVADASDYSKNAASVAANINVLTFTTKAGGAAGPITKTYSITPVINTFCLPFDFAAAVSYVVTPEGGTASSGAIRTVRQFLTAIGNPTVFGWYDSVAKKQEGFTVVYSTALDSSLLVPNSSYGTAAALLDSALRKDFPYQISVSGAAVNLTLTGTRE